MLRRILESAHKHQHLARGIFLGIHASRPSSSQLCFPRVLAHGRGQPLAFAAAAAAAAAAASAAPSAPAPATSRRISLGSRRTEPAEAAAPAQPVAASASTAPATAAPDDKAPTASESTTSTPEKSSPSKESSWGVFGSGWKKWAGRRDGDEGYQFGDVTRHIMTQATHTTRQLSHGYRNLQLDVRDRKTQLAQQLVGSVLDEAERPAGAEVSPHKDKGKEAKRRWARACEAVHSAHSLGADAPAPPERAFLPIDKEGAATDENSREARGVLEVTLLAFSSKNEHGGVPPTLMDGSAARDPVCQFAVGSRCTGSLRPADAAAADEDARPSSARFAIDEVYGCDVLVHVFDTDSSNFNMGMEENCFCGGAFVPLSVLFRRCPQPQRLLSKNAIEMDLAVALLPLEAVQHQSRLEAAEPGSGIPRPAVSLGHVFLRLRLTLYDSTPALLYGAIPCYCEIAEVSSSHIGRLDEPTSVLKAVAAAVSRAHKAMDYRPWLQVVDELREAPKTAVLLYALWTFLVLFVPVYLAPICVLSVVPLFSYKMSKMSHLARVNDPPRLYSDEQEDPDRDATLIEWGKKRAAMGIKVSIFMMELATRINAYSAQLERLMFVFSLRDPYISAACGVLALMVTFCMVACIWVMQLIIGVIGAGYVVWVCGCIWLLPARARAALVRAYHALEELSERIIGPGKISQMIESLWRRIPDDVGAVHYDLFDRYVLVP
eukprot:gnl/TRDRNA2_/TRDRNA2_166419_c0_seq4.p1 gnl/TRDRNA2_/TRDRNA2_166419_c0~~gnl/TRDRNA2_/TRDRNA2_166419_c0_seq4.p1  ORF type:complete len:719 (-),score=110.16 gnl/TRDRNA2_/TRDRNA2_166419_c0_seq4:120-2276(-)